MPKRRAIFGREDAPRFGATVETRDEGVPQPREIKSDENQLNDKRRHGFNKAVKRKVNRKKR